MRLSGLLVLITVLLVNGALWIRLNLPFRPDESKYPVHSLSYNPYQRDQNPFRHEPPQRADIERDMQILKSKTKGIRIYRATDADMVMELARKQNLSVTVSAWLGRNKDENESEVEEVLKLAVRYPNVTRVILGNETQLEHSVPKEELLTYLDKARKKLRGRVPVSTAEPWDFWLNNPEFVKHVDYLAIHILPYWREIPIQNAIEYVINKYHAVKKAYPYKMVVIAETGWPSDGPQRGAAEASQVNQAEFTREFIRRAETEKINYNIIEAFDQPWKSAIEGRAGEHWGLMDANRLDKFPITGLVLEDPRWKLWALSSAIVGCLAMAFYLLRRPRLSVRGQIFSAVMIQVAASTATELARQAAGQYMSPGDIAFWTIMFSAEALLAVIFLTDTAEIADVVGGRPLKKRYRPAARLPDNACPMVSLHVACCKEPPEMVIATIESLGRLDYPNFEVIVVDNNTADEALWRPVEKRCAELGERFRFYTLGRWPGYKAGALNFALRVTDPRAEIVGVVDADYVVETNWLRSTAGYFKDQDVAVVQAPQEHRAWEGNLFQRMENDEYSGFFRIGMVQRNEDNAIIQHGTMTLIRRRYLDQVNGWAEWCICEDAELGLRMLLLGKRCVYIDHAFGRGLVPDSYVAYSKQRFRWAYGGMRIMRRYWRELLGFKSGLTFAQRYQFVKGWLPWIGDGLHMFFTTAALVWSAFLIADPLHTDFPDPIFLYPALALIFLKLAGTALTYAKRVRIGGHRTLLAMIAGGSLTHTIAKAVLQGLLFSGKPFYRTPKMDKGHPLAGSLLFVHQEIILAALLCAAAASVLAVFGAVNDDAVLWAIALVLQALPYFTAIAASVISSRPEKVRQVELSSLQGDSAGIAEVLPVSLAPLEKAAEPSGSSAAGSFASGC